MKKQTVIRNRSLIFILLAGLAGCATTRAYSGSSGDRGVALVKGHGVTIQQVDEFAVGSSSSSVEILPGRHVIQISPNASNYGMLGSSKKVLTVVMQAEAGKEYSITSERGARTTCAYEINPATGAPNFQRSAGCVVHPDLIDKS